MSAHAKRQRTLRSVYRERAKQTRRIRVAHETCLVSLLREAADTHAILTFRSYTRDERQSLIDAAHHALDVQAMLIRQEQYDAAQRARQHLYARLESITI